ncbi:MAG: fasciclin domain-containing protein, partial [Candidatus Tumulicola sp.]
MGRLKSMALALVIAGSVTTAAFAQDSMQDPMVGGAAMYPSKNIVQNAMNSPDHTTLVALVKKAGLVATLEGPGPFTVF